jgi:flavin reductase (DIM6/NTAB) family NADH-FMN oxidoreductase RutF/rubredoxin
MIDKKALYTLTYGLYIISSKDGDSGRDVGCTVDTFQQVTSAPPRVGVAVNKENYTAEIIQKSGIFAATVVAKSAPMELIGLFGFQSSRDVDKFAEVSHQRDEQGIAYVDEDVVARFSVKVINTMDVGTHLIFIGDVVESEKLSDEDPITYTYYRQVKGGKVPPAAPSYQAGGDVEAVVVESAVVAKATAKTAWHCTVCGHIEIAEELSDDFRCPLCKQPKDAFVKVES